MVACREIYRGHDGDLNKVLPYVLVDLGSGGISGDIDTLGTDDESCQVTFEIRTKRDIKGEADAAFEAMRKNFRAARLDHEGIVTEQFRMISWDGPKLVNRSTGGDNEFTYNRSIQTYLFEFQLPDALFGSRES